MDVNLRAWQVDVNMTSQDTREHPFAGIGHVARSKVGDRHDAPGSSTSPSRLQQPRSRDGHAATMWGSRGAWLARVRILPLGLAMVVAISVQEHPLFHDVYLFDADGWVLQAIDIKNFLAIGHEITPYNHSFTPLYPFLLAILDFFTSSMEASVFLVGVLMFLGIAAIYKGDELLFYTIPMLFFFVFMTMSLVMFVSVLAWTATMKFFETPGWKGAFMMSASYTILMFSREILWPMMLFPFVLFLYKRRWAIFPIMAVPVICYGLFFLLTSSTDLVLDRLGEIERAGTLDPMHAITHVFIAVGAGPACASIKKDFKTTSILAWIALFVGARLLAPGPLWAHYWFPIVPHLYMLVRRGRLYPLVMVATILLSLFFAYSFMQDPTGMFMFYAFGQDGPTI